MAFIPVGQRPLAFIDTETTGLDARVHEVIDVAVVFDADVAERLRIPYLIRPVNQNYAYYSTRIKPEHLERAEPRALEINGYTTAEWVGAASVIEAVKVLQVILKDVVCCGHNVGFDTDFIQQTIRSTGSTFRMDYHKIDTIALVYEHLVPVGLERMSLDAVRDFLGWPKEGGHRALRDALDARRLYKLLTEDTVGWTREAWSERSHKWP